MFFLGFFPLIDSFLAVDKLSFTLYYIKKSIGVNMKQVKMQCTTVLYISTYFAVLYSLPTLLGVFENNENTCSLLKTSRGDLITFVISYSLT